MSVVNQMLLFIQRPQYQNKESALLQQESFTRSKIVMSIDILLFNGGFLPTAIPSRKIQRYKIRKFIDLNSLLGNNWHFRGLNSNGDYGYVILETVEFIYGKAGQFLSTFLVQHHL